MSVIKLLLGFSPWLAFLLIAHGSLFRLKLGVMVAFALSIIMGITKLHRGIILWVGLAFFLYATIAVVIFENLWTAKHMGVIANGVLALFTWFTILIKKPFTLEYAKAETDPSVWKHPVFMQINYVLSATWGGVFSLNTLLALGKMQNFLLPEVAYDGMSHVFLIGAVIFNSWYPKQVRRRLKQEPDS